MSSKPQFTEELCTIIYQQHLEHKQHDRKIFEKGKTKCNTDDFEGTQSDRLETKRPIELSEYHSLQPNTTPKIII